MKILIAQTDDRMRYLKKLLNLNHDVKCFNSQETLDQHIDEFDMIILPLVKLCSNESFQYNDECISYQHIKKTKEFCIVTAYKSESECEYKTYAYLEDEQFIKENAILTVEGILYYMIDLTNQSIFAQNVDILGYGVCGKALSDLFKKLSIKHRIIRRKKEIDNEIDYDSWIISPCGDIIVQCTSQNVLKLDDRILRDKPCIIDICSNSFDLTKQCIEKDINYIKVKSLPVIFTCKSGANLIYEYMKRELLC